MVSPFYLETPFPYPQAAAVGLGLLVGSFLNVCICRIPEGLSIVSPPSHCPGCDGPIKWYDNVPLLSYLILRGRCRRCGERISPQYPLVEALCGVLFLMVYRRFGLTRWLPVYLPFVSALLVITFIDLKHRIIPNVITLPGAVLGLGSMTLFGFLGGPAGPMGVTPLGSLAGLLLGGGSLLLVAAVYEKLTGRIGMGGGDIKLLALVGSLLGPPGVLVTVFGGSLFGLVVGAPLGIASGEGRRHAVPFGPFLAFAALLYVFAGPEMLEWYLNDFRLRLRSLF